MKALSLWQPWASLIAIGVKIIETRGWPTSYRGPLAIHAAQKLLLPNDPEFLAVLERYGLLSGTLPRGAVLGWTTLNNCRQMTVENIAWEDPLERILGDYRPGRWMWDLGEFHKLEIPHRCRGRQGFWNWGE